MQLSERAKCWNNSPNNVLSRFGKARIGSIPSAGRKMLTTPIARNRRLSALRRYLGVSLIGGDSSALTEARVAPAHHVLDALEDLDARQPHQELLPRLRATDQNQRAGVLHRHKAGTDRHTSTGHRGRDRRARP